MKLLPMSRAPVLWNYSESFHYYLVDVREFGRNNLNFHFPLR